MSWKSLKLTILALDYKKGNDHKIFHWSAKLTDSDSGIEEPFKSIHQSIMTQIESYATKDCIVLDVIIKHNIKISEW